MDLKTIGNKQEMRRRLAALSFSEKIKILEKLRDREMAADDLPTSSELKRTQPR